jgi:hypothetical protein
MSDETTTEPDPLRKLHQHLVQAVVLIGSCLPLGITSGISPDTAMAIGEAMGAIRKAKALVGRDIDDAERTS